MPTFGSLFAGIGGFDLGLERAGWECRWQVENDPYCQRVLAKHWPDVARYGDVKGIDPRELEPVDLVCGGFPCQPVSRAGRRMAQDDDRWLWPEFARVVRGVRPRHVLVENVPGLLVHGMGDVLGDLAALGYDAEWESIPAAAVGAPHIRDRVWIVAHAQCVRPLGWQDAAAGDDEHGYDAGRPQEAGVVAGGGPSSGPRRVADADRERRPQRRWTGTTGAQQSGPEHGREVDDAGSRRHGASHEAVFPRGRTPELSSWWATEPDVGRVAHGVPRRVDRLRCLGNAVVPQVVEWIGRRLMEVA